MRASRFIRQPEQHSDPLIGVGGHCTYNPEPIADFVDFVVLGDGEEVVGEITELLREWKGMGRSKGSRRPLLREMAKIAGVYFLRCIRSYTTVHSPRR